jgi:tRNA-dihydrouridine synthase 3
MTSEGDPKVFEALPSADTNLAGDQSGNHETNGSAEPLSDKKRIRTGSQDVEIADAPVKRQKGVAPIKAE